MIENCSNEIVNDREQYWIKFYNAYENGYNCTLGGEGSVLLLNPIELEEIASRY